MVKHQTSAEGEGQTIEVFRDFSAAKAWLGVKEDAEAAPQNC